jgi:hypothetical protein
MVGKTGLEPVTPRLSSVCSNQLSYMPGDALGFRPAFAGRRRRGNPGDPGLVELRRFELLTSCLQSRRSTN